MSPEGLYASTGSPEFRTTSYHHGNSLYSDEMDLFKNRPLYWNHRYYRHLFKYHGLTYC